MCVLAKLKLYMTRGAESSTSSKTPSHRELRSPEQTGCCLYIFGPCAMPICHRHTFPYYREAPGWHQSTRSVTYISLAERSPPAATCTKQTAGEEHSATNCSVPTESQNGRTANKAAFGKVTDHLGVVQMEGPQQEYRAVMPHKLSAITQLLESFFLIEIIDNLFKEAKP